MEQKKENEVGQTPYSSILVKGKETVLWNVFNLSDLQIMNCWTAMCFSFTCRGSLGRDYTWRLSLDRDEDYLYGRAELRVPLNHRIPYSMKFHILNDLNDKDCREEIEYEAPVREITSLSEPQKWKIMRTHDLLCLQNAEDLLGLRVEITTYGSETTQGLQAQNYPV